MQVSTAEFRKGLRIVFDGEPYTIVDFQHVKPGKGGAFVRTKLKHMRQGRVIDNTFRSGEKVELVDFEDKHMQFLYKDDRFHFMDMETYDQVSLSEDEVGDAALYLKDNTEVEVLYIDGSPVSLELPNFIELAVARTDPGVRGDTAQGGTKPATLETGAGAQAGRGASRRRRHQRHARHRRGADGRNVLSRLVADDRAVRAGRRRRQAGPGPLHHRSDEAHERDRIAGRRPHREDPRGERAARGIWAAAVPDRARGLSHRAVVSSRLADDRVGAARGRRVAPGLASPADRPRR